MKWIKEILLVLTQKVNPKQAFIIIIVGIVAYAGIQLFDRYFDYREAVDVNDPNQKRKIVKTDNPMKEYGVSNVEYANEYNQVKRIAGSAQ